MTTTNAPNSKTPATVATVENEIPEFLRRQKDEPKVEAPKPVEKPVEKPVTIGDLKVVSGTDKDATAKTELAELKKAKTKGRIEKMKAKKNGDLTKMPLSGKAALALIKSVNVAKPNAKPKVAAKPKAKAKAAKKDGKSKLQTIGSLLKRANGCTNAEILDATEWPSVSVPAVAKALKLKLKKVKEPGKPTRYFGS